MDRDFILENFRTISQIQNFEECIQILESVGWNLESALNSVDNGENYTIPEVESQPDINFQTSQPILSSTNNRNLLFNVDVRGEIIKIIINEDKTVGDLADLVAIHVNEPRSKFKINGFKMPYNRHTLLKSLNLELENYVIANSVDSLVFPAQSSSATNIVATKQFHLSIDVYMNEEFKQQLDLCFDGKESVGKVKSYVARVLETSVVKQKWTGWPKYSNDEMSLQSCGIGENSSFKVHVNVEQKSSKKDFCIKECHKSSIETSLNNSRIEEIENEEEDDYYDYPDDVELEQETQWSIKKSLALMPQDAHKDAMIATLHFSNQFILRYCTDDSANPSPQKPPFFIGSLEDALATTLNLFPKQRKPLFLYLHHEESIQANIFCTQVLCYSEIILYFTQLDYMIWPWDITHAENKSQLLTWLAKNFGNQVTSPIRIMMKDQFPVLIALSKSQGNFEILEFLDGSKSKDEILIHLWNINAQFHDKQQIDILAWEESEIRKMVKMEQDVAYQESLSKDQIKEKEHDDKKRRIEEEEKNKMLQLQKLEEQKLKQIELALTKVPMEPEEGPDTVTIRLRLPPNVDTPTNNSSLTRRFLYSHTLGQLIAYVESLGFLRSEFKLLMSYPRTNLTQKEDQTVTLKSLGIPKRENLILEKI